MTTANSRGVLLHFSGLGGETGLVKGIGDPLQCHMVGCSISAEVELQLDTEPAPDIPITEPGRSHHRAYTGSGSFIIGATGTGGVVFGLKAVKSCK